MKAVFFEEYYCGATQIAKMAIAKNNWNQNDILVIPIEQAIDIEKYREANIPTFVFSRKNRHLQYVANQMKKNGFEPQNILEEPITIDSSKFDKAFYFEDLIVEKDIIEWKPLTHILNLSNLDVHKLEMNIHFEDPIYLKIRNSYNNLIQIHFRESVLNNLKPLHPSKIPKFEKEFEKGNFDLVLGIWGDRKYIDTLVNCVISYRESGNTKGFIRVGCPQKFTYPEIDLYNDLGIIQYPVGNKVKHRSRWSVLPTNLPQNRLYLISEVDCAFTGEIQNKTIEIGPSLSYWPDKKIGLTLWNVFNSLQYHDIVSSAKGIDLFFNKDFNSIQNILNQRTNIKNKNIVDILKKLTYNSNEEKIFTIALEICEHIPKNTHYFLPKINGCTNWMTWRSYPHPGVIFKDFNSHTEGIKSLKKDHHVFIHYPECDSIYHGRALGKWSV